MFGSVIRKGLGRLQVLLGWFSRPKKIQRTPEESSRLAKEASGLSLYDYRWCPNSLKTRHEIHHLNIEIERRDIQNSPVHQDYLLAQFGQLKAPCLRIEENGKIQWLDEPEDIVVYLHKRFGSNSERLTV